MAQRQSFKGNSGLKITIAILLFWASSYVWASALFYEPSHPFSESGVTGWINTQLGLTKARDAGCGVPQ